MKRIPTPRFEILIAEHSGMCFGVRQAIATTEKLLARQPATILGQLAHNPTVKDRLTRQGAHDGKLEHPNAPTREVVITAHGASDRDRRRWQAAGYQVTDTTCPLVRVAHAHLARLVRDGYQPVIIGKEGHIEVRGLQGDFPGAVVVLQPEDLNRIPEATRIGVISQTTQPVDRVEALVTELRRSRPDAEVVWRDTVCHPTKDRQRSLSDLCRAADLVLAVGGRNSNNTAQLARTARQLGCRAHHIESPGEIHPDWLEGVRKVGLTAGTSTLEESLEAVSRRLQEMAGTLSARSPAESTR